METVTSFPAAGMPADELGRILLDYLALDRARLFRRLLVPRCAALALAAFVIGALVHGFSMAARGGSVALFVAPAVAAWAHGGRISRRLGHRLDGDRTSVYEIDSL